MFITEEAIFKLQLLGLDHEGLKESGALVLDTTDFKPFELHFRPLLL